MRRKRRRQQARPSRCWQRPDPPNCSLLPPLPLRRVSSGFQLIDIKKVLRSHGDYSVKIVQLGGTLRTLAH